MKNLIFFLIFIFTPFLNSQWFYQNSGTTENLYESFFLDENRGWIVGASGTILKTTDAGKNWENINLNITNALSYIQFLTDSVGFTAGANGIILKTTDAGNSWSTLSSGNTNTIHEGCFINDSIGWFVGNNGLLLKTTDGGSHWIISNISSGNFNWIEFLNQDTGFACSSTDGQVWKSIDGGITWTLKINLGTEIWQTCFLDNQNGWVVGDNGLILKTTDCGESWQFSNSPTSNKLRSVYFHNSDEGWIVGKNQTILHTTDSGVNWQIVISGYYSELLHVKFIDDNSGCIVGTNGIILITNNNGGGGVVPVELTYFDCEIIDNKEIELKWNTATELNNLGFEIERRFEDFSWTKIGFVEGNGTISQETNYFFTDSPIQSGKYSYRLKQIDFNGTFEYSSEINVEFNESQSFQLYQNYPNPFNPTTKFLFFLPEEQQIKLSILNVLGEEILISAEGIYKSGNHQIQFDASKLSSGMYYYSLTSEKFHETRKMILIK